MNATRLSTLFVTLFLVALAAQTSRAQDTKDAAILPYIDEGTFAIARLDIDRVDPDALAEYMATAADSFIKMTGVPAEHQARMKQDMVESADKAKAWLADMTAAGATRMYFLIDMADLNAPDSHGPTMVVPVADGDDGQKVIDVLTRDNRRMQSALIGKAVVFSSAFGIERLTKRLEPGLAPVKLPDLAAAMDAAGDAPLRIALVPGESARTFVEENLPQIPAPLGGGETKLLSRGVRYATVAVAQKPAMQARLMVRAQDAATAKQLADVINKGKAFAEQNVKGMADADDLAKQLAAIQPTVESEVVSVSVDPLMMLSGIRTAGSRRAAAIPPPAGAAPAKPDDGGL